ncbi:hypothetical protein [Hymenobacter psychrophilus]|uniref:Uncharacterized protein n=1 Tax=Hymenobacter psychrophilus TaxID=651662 RepID=A0A1H3IY25_9BACT|nr:hypothetical protein [Hymenobacter psychrophilus]SDY32552.1 hypothetical protein SAMN04488069_107200 [Hymenobacter psychrophilus]
MSTTPINAPDPSRDPLQTVHDTPNYGEFGHPDNPKAPTNENESVTKGGESAPSVAFAEQRGSAPQNLDPAAVRQAEDAEYDEQREGWAKDDPRYGGGTRNWPTNEPANHTTAPASDTQEERNTNVGTNDNPDEFSALRADNGRGIPGSGKENEMPNND